MSETTQSYATHRRFLPPIHFFALPVLTINVVVTAIRLVRAPSLDSVWQVLVALALVVVLVSARWMSNRVQDRVIRGEEQQRLARLAPEDGRTLANALTTGQLIGLRFASDPEVVALARRCVAGELKSCDSVKRAVVGWRPDHLRA